MPLPPEPADACKAGEEIDPRVRSEAQNVPGDDAEHDLDDRGREREFDAQHRGQQDQQGRDGRGRQSVDSAPPLPTDDSLIEAVSRAGQAARRFKERASSRRRKDAKERRLPAAG
jgi:hypothetical protein